MKRYQIIIIIVAALVILGVAAFFIFRGTAQQEEIPTLQTIDTADTGEATDTADTGEETDAVPVTEFQLGMDDVVATVNGTDVTGAEVLDSYQSIVNYYGEPDENSLELYYSVAMEQAITLKLIKLTAAEKVLDQFTQEETDNLYATSDSEWQYALDNYVSNNIDTSTATDEQKTAAYADAEAYYSLMGYTKDNLRKSYLDNEIYTRVTDELCKDVAVTEEEILTYYNDTVKNDEATYGTDADAYEMQMMMVQYGYADQEPWYKPAGYRYVKHILLAVDEGLMTTYTDLLARYEEQLSDEEAAADTTDTTATDAAATTDPTATVEPTQEPVTAEQIEAAKAAIIASVQTKIDEINAKLAEGVSFEDLMTEYGVDTAMTDGSNPSGYEVSLASYGYVPEFVSAAFSVNAIGDISEPYISEYGVHIVKYVGDVPAGPLELTDDLKASIEQTLLDEKSNDVLDAWHNAADIQYTGIVRSVEEIQAAETTDTDTTAE